MIPAPLWNTCDFVLQFHFATAYIPGKINTAADFLSQLVSHSIEQIIQKIKEDIPLQPIEVKTASSELAQVGQIFFQTDDAELPSEEQLWQQTKKRNTVRTEPPGKTVSHWHMNGKCTNRLMHFTEPFNKARLTLIEQDADPVLLNFKKRLHELPFDEQILAISPRYNYYSRNKKRILTIDDISYRQNYNDVGNFTTIATYGFYYLCN